LCKFLFAELISEANKSRRFGRDPDFYVGNSQIIYFS